MMSNLTCCSSRTQAWTVFTLLYVGLMKGTSSSALPVVFVVLGALALARTRAARQDLLASLLPPWEALDAYWEGICSHWNFFEWCLCLGVPLLALAGYAGACFVAQTLLRAACTFFYGCVLVACPGRRLKACLIPPTSYVVYVCVVGGQGLERI
jgi:hypothetical protein